MSSWEKTLAQVLDPRRDRNVVFTEVVTLLRRLGFDERMGSGSHHIFFRDGVEEIINLQPLGNGKAKPYQVRQVRKIILDYKLHCDE
jgi:hypothetical protein